MNNINEYIKLNDLETFFKIAVPIADYLAPINYSPNGSYDNKYFLACLIDFIKNHVYWKHYIGPECPLNNKRIKGKYLNQIHNRYVKCGVYEQINKKLLDEYLKNGKEGKIKYQIIDSSFIQNKRGSTKNQINNNLLNDKTKQKNIKIANENKYLPKKERKKEETFIDFNKYNGRKKYFKVSSITDQYGIPFGSVMIQSKESDSISIEKTINNLAINLNTLQNSKINRYKQYFIADALYDSNKNNKYLKSLGYSPIISPNRRNTKDKIKLAEKELIKKNNKKIYVKRVIIESFFSWIKNYAIINQCYEKSISSYNGLFILASSITIFKHI